MTGLAALLAALAALVASFACLYRSRRLEALVSEHRYRGVSLEKRVSQLESILSRALQVLDDIDEASKLKRKRRRRYIAALILYEGRLPLDPRVVQRSIEDAVRRLAGEVGVAEARPQVVYYDPVRGAVIIRTNHLARNLVLASLLLIREIGGARVRVVPLRTAGTIRSAKRYLGILERIPTRAG